MIPDLASLGLSATIAVFLGAAVVIAVAGTRLTRVADRLADRTGLGEALVGAVLLGAITSLAGVVTTLTAAIEGHPALAVSNAIGGIAAQTAFLGIADIVYRRANLEHAAASLQNLVQSTLLIGLLVLLLVAGAAPPVSVLGVHPITPLIFLAYAGGLVLVSRVGDEPMWRPRATADTVEDTPQRDSYEQSATRLWAELVVTGALVAGSGYVVAITGIALADHTGLSESFVGALLTAVVTSLPELVVSIAAVRRGALTLAVGNIVGGNSFEVLVVAAADIAYRNGSILHAMSGEQTFVIALTALLMCILLMGLLHRQRRGIGGIGWESFSILVLFAAGYAVLFFWE